MRFDVDDIRRFNSDVEAAGWIIKEANAVAFEGRGQILISWHGDIVKRLADDYKVWLSELDRDESLCRLLGVERERIQLSLSALSQMQPVTEASGHTDWSLLQRHFTPSFVAWEGYCYLHKSRSDMLERIRGFILDFALIHLPFVENGEIPNFSFSDLLPHFNGMSIIQSLPLARRIHGFIGAKVKESWGTWNEWTRGSDAHLPNPLLYLSEIDAPLSNYREWSQVDWEHLRVWISDAKQHHDDILIQELKNHPAYAVQKIDAVPDRSLPALKWSGTQTDLVYIIDRLKRVGLLDPDTTDTAVIGHIDYGSNAKNKDKTYRDTRKKIQDGGSHPSYEKIEALIRLLREGLS